MYKKGKLASTSGPSQTHPRIRESEAFRIGFPVEPLLVTMLIIMSCLKSPGASEKEPQNTQQGVDMAASYADDRAHACA